MTDAPVTKSWRETRPTQRNRGRLRTAEQALRDIRYHVDGDNAPAEALDEIADIITTWEARRYPEPAEESEQ